MLFNKNQNGDEKACGLKIQKDSLEKKIETEILH